MFEDRNITTKQLKDDTEDNTRTFIYINNMSQFLNSDVVKYYVQGMDLHIFSYFVIFMYTSTVKFHYKYHSKWRPSSLLHVRQLISVP